MLIVNIEQLSLLSILYLALLPDSSINFIVYNMSPLGFLDVQLYLLGSLKMLYYLAV